MVPVVRVERKNGNAIATNRRNEAIGDRTLARAGPTGDTDHEGRRCFHGPERTDLQRAPGTNVTQDAARTFTNKEKRTLSLVLATLFAVQIAAASYFCIWAATLQLKSPSQLLVRAAAVLMVFATCVAALVAPGSPTGVPTVDGFMRVGLVLVCVAASARVRNGLLLVVAFLDLVPMLARSNRVGIAPLVFAACALGVAVGRSARRPRSSLLGAAVGALLGNALLRQPTSMTARVPSLIAAVVVVIVAVAALVAMPSRQRNRAMFGALVVAIIGVVGTAGAYIVARRARGHAEAAIAVARLALDAASHGDATTAGADFTRAAVLMRTARSQLNSPAALLGRYLPVVAPNLDAVRLLTSSGAEVTASAADAVAAIDLPHMRTADGRIDVDRIAALRQPVANAQRIVANALHTLDTTDGPWIAPPLRRQALGLRAELVRATRSTEDATSLLEALPELLGRSGPRRYLIVVPTPAEARGSGGLIGNYGEITANNGRVTLEHFGRTEELLEHGVPQAQRVVDAPADYLRRYMPFQVNQLWQNVTLSPDFPSAAQAMASLYPQSGGRPIDGVIAADPFALAGILRITGPITVDGWPQSFTTENTPRILLYELYAALTLTREQNQARAEIQRLVAERAWSQLFSGSLPSPNALSAALGEPVRERHLQLWAKRPTEQAFMQRLGASGAIPPVQGDWFSVVTNNAGANKIDWYLQRTISYDAEVDLASGTVQATATVEMHNGAPASGVAVYLIGNKVVPQAPMGTSIQYISLYSPLHLDDATIDSAPLKLESDTEVGRNVYSGWIRIPPGGQTTIKVHLRGRNAPAGAQRYDLQLGCQALVNRDVARVHIQLTDRSKRSTTATGLSTSADGFRAEEPLDCRKHYTLQR